MAEITLQIRGIKELRTSFFRAPKIVSRELDKGIARAMATLERTAKKESPVDTGRLRASHRTRLGNLRGELVPTVRYATFVHQPGVTRNWKGNPWMERTVRMKEREVNKIIQKAVDTAISKSFK